MALGQPRDVAAYSDLVTARSGSLFRTAYLMVGDHLVIEQSAVGRRFSPRVEAAAYFCAAEATRDLDPPVLVLLAVEQDHLRLVVTGTDRSGIALEDIRDRVESARGTVAITLDDGHTVVAAQLPDHTPSSRPGPNAALVT